METVSQATLLEALRQAMERPKVDALTTAEMVDLILPTTNRSRRWVEAKVRAAIVDLRKSGRWEIVDVQRESAVDGRLCTVKAYRLKSAA